MTSILCLLVLSSFQLFSLADGCLLASNGSRPLPEFVRPGGGLASRFRENPIQAIITSYRFNCFGVITEWRAFVDGSSSGHFESQPYSISFQVWRPSSPTNTHTLIGVNHFSPIPLADDDSPDRGIVTGRPPESERIEVQPGDMIGFYLVSSRDNDDGIQFAGDSDNNPDYQDEAVWFAIDNNAFIPTVLMRLSVGSEGIFTSFTSRAPLITATIISQSACPVSSTSVLQPEPTSTTRTTAPTSTPIPLPPIETNPQQPTPSIPVNTASLPPSSDGDNTALLIAFTVAVVTVAAMITLLVIIGANIVSRKKANKLSKGFTLTHLHLREVIGTDRELATPTQIQPPNEIMVSSYDYPDNMESNSPSMTKNEAYGDISSQNNNPQMTWNLAYVETSAVSRTAEATEPQIREEIYDYVRNPDSAICDPPTARNPAYGDQNYYINKGLGGAAEVRMTRNEAYTGVRQPSSNNEHSIITKENEAYNVTIRL